jgi:hypothetical protein
MALVHMHMAVFDAAAEELQHHLQQEAAQDPQADALAAAHVQFGQHVQHGHAQQEGTAESQQQLDAIGAGVGITHPSSRQQRQRQEEQDQQAQVHG